MIAIIKSETDMIPLLISYNREYSIDGVMSFAPTFDRGLVLAQPSLDLDKAILFNDKTSPDGGVVSSAQVVRRVFDHQIKKMLQDTFSRPEASNAYQNVLGGIDTVTPVLARVNGKDRVMAVVVAMRGEKHYTRDDPSRPARKGTSHLHHLELNQSAADCELAVMWMAKRHTEAFIIPEYDSSSGLKNDAVLPTDHIRGLFKAVNVVVGMRQKMKGTQNAPGADEIFFTDPQYIDADTYQIFKNLGKPLSVAGAGMDVVREHINDQVKTQRDFEKEMQRLEPLAKKMKRFKDKIMNLRGQAEQTPESNATPTYWMGPYLNHMSETHRAIALQVFGVERTPEGAMYLNRGALTEAVQDKLDDQHKIDRTASKM